MATRSPRTDNVRDARLGRLSRLAGMASAGVNLARGSLARDPVAPLTQAVETLGELRGLATKAGQMAGMWVAMLPPEERARAVPVLARLRAATSASSPQAVRASLERELGSSREGMFASFDELPFASASLGQVHRAVLHPELGGMEVAVKIQHPGIDVALRSDLANVEQLGGVAAWLALSGPGEMFDEVRARMLDELDYGQEASWQLRFGELFAKDPVLAIPAVIPTHSRRRVLTTELVRGQTVEQAARGIHARSHGRAIRRFMRTSWLDHGLLFADPHAGNWIFHEDGRVTVLDFGSIVPFDADIRALVSDSLRALSRGDEAGALAALRHALALPASGAHDGLGAPTLLALRPLAQDAPVMARDLEALYRATTEAKKRMFGHRVALPRWLPLLLRALLGLMSTLAELEGEAG